MTRAPLRSLAHEYELFVRAELVTYKANVPESTLSEIRTEACSTLTGKEQLSLVELLIGEEVDRLIRWRLRIPSYSGWQRRRLRPLASFRIPLA